MPKLAFPAVIQCQTPSTSAASSDQELEGINISALVIRCTYSIVLLSVVAQVSWQFTGPADWVLSHWDPYTVLRYGLLAFVYCNIV